MTPTEPTITIPATGGPKLLFVSSGARGLHTTVTHIDTTAVEDPRERALCRALLLYALALLDASELANPNGTAR